MLKNVMSKRNLIVGSALFLAGAPLFAAETSSGNSAVAPTPRAYVNCPGITSVPVTADAEQALPLHQVATLSCGEPVSVLADNEGYTVHVRTSDGREGFVARMYVTNEASRFAGRDEVPAVSANATPENGVVRWNAGAPGCEEFTVNGRTIESVTSSGVTIQVSLQDTGWKLRATVAVSNSSNANVYVMSSLVTLDELQPGLRNLRAEDPARLSHWEANHQVLRTESNAMPSPSAVAYHGTTPSLTAAAYHPAQAAAISSDSLDSASVKALALKTTNLAPGKKTAGVVWFARDPGARELSLRLSVGDVIYDFPFSFQQNK